MTPFIKFIPLVILLLITACQEKPEKKAEQLAREQMTRTIGLSAVNRSVVEVRPSVVGWMVLFRNANASCDEGSFWPGACDFRANIFRDVYACVERDWSIRQMGATGPSESLGAEDLCQASPSNQTATPAPTLVPRP